MLDTKLVLFEGIPGAGKSTTSRYMSLLLNRHGIKNTLIHELSSDHPINLFNHILLSNVEYDDIRREFHDTSVLSDVTDTVNDEFYTVDLLKLRRLNPNTACVPFHKLLGCAWISDPRRYLDFSITRLEKFVEKVTHQEEPIFMEGSVIQFFVDGLLRHNVESQSIKSTVKDLVTVLSKLNPMLVFLQKSDVEESIRRTFQIRGEVYDISDHFPYAQTRHNKGFDLYVEFLNDYQQIAHEVFDDLTIRKIGIDTSEHKWDVYHNHILHFLGLPQYNPLPMTVSDPYVFVGTYVFGDKTFRIAEQDRGLCIQYNTYNKPLIPKDKVTFSISDNTVDIQFMVDDDEKIADSFIIGGSDISQDWSQVGNVFRRRH